MSQTVNVLAPSANFAVQTAGGTQYVANNNSLILNVPAGGDLIDLMKAGCQPLPLAETEPVLPWVTGQFYGLPPAATLEALLTVTATLYAYPIYIPNAVTVKSLSLGVTTGQTGGAAHIGIYADAGGKPGNLVYDSGAVSGLTSTTTVTDAIASNNPVLTAGWYWVATIFTASSTFPSVAAIKTLYTGSISNMLGYDTAAHALATASEAVTGVSATGTYGALPSVFPTATLTLNADTPAVAIGV